MDLAPSLATVNLYAVDKNSTTALAKWNAVPSEIKDASREHESEGNGRHSTVMSDRSEEDDFKDQMPSAVEKLINHTTTPKRKITANLQTCSAVSPSSADRKKELFSNKKKKKRRKTGWSSKKNALQRGQVVKIWYIGSDDQGDWLEVQWLGSEKTTKQLTHNLPSDYQPLVAKAMAKGSGQGVSWTYCAGNGAVASRTFNGVSEEVLCNGATQLVIVHQHETKWCHLNSLLNVMRVSKTKGKKVRKMFQKQIFTSCLGDLSDVADKAAGELRVNLVKIQGDVDFVLQQKKDKWLLLKGVHCISIDCARNLIFDSGRKKTLHLTKANLKLCGFHDNLDDLRMVVH
jgi:hypothetical protein